MDEEKRMKKMLVIAGASKAIRYKEENPNAIESEVIQHVSDNASKIIEDVDEPL